MRILISGCTVSAAEWYARRPERIGALLTPATGNRVPDEQPFAADNGCFAGLDGPRWLRMLARLSVAPRKPLWICCPDAVGDMGETWRLYGIWAPVVRALGFPVALVLQDGLELFKWRARLPSTWDDLAAVFVGGSTAWKESAHAMRFCQEAKDRGKWVHVGRVNTGRRIERLANWGSGVVDSFDGRNWNAWGGKKIGLGVKWIDRALVRATRPGLFSGAA